DTDGHRRAGPSGASRCPGTARERRGVVTSRGPGPPPVRRGAAPGAPRGHGGWRPDAGREAGPGARSTAPQPRFLATTAGRQPALVALTRCRPAGAQRGPPALGRHQCPRARRRVVVPRSRPSAAAAGLAGGRVVPLDRRLARAVPGSLRRPRRRPALTRETTPGPTPNHPDGAAPRGSFTELSAVLVRNEPELRR